MVLKTNYKAGDKVIVTKEKSKFKDLDGEVITNNPGTRFMPLSIDLKQYGTWSFNYEDVKFAGKEKPEKAEVYAFDKPAPDTSEKLKRAYTKRTVNKPKSKTKTQKVKNAK